jgi:hypothetical protein
MFKPNDWKNIEMTGYYLATPGSGSKNGAAHIEHVMRVLLTAQVLSHALLAITI